MVSPTPKLHVFDIHSICRTKEIVLNKNVRNLDLTIKCFLWGKYCWNEIFIEQRSLKHWNIWKKLGGSNPPTPYHLLFPYYSLGLLHLISHSLWMRSARLTRSRITFSWKAGKKAQTLRGRQLASLCRWQASQLLSDHLSTTYPLTTQKMKSKITRSPKWINPVTYTPTFCPSEGPAINFLGESIYFNY